VNFFGNWADDIKREYDLPPLTDEMIAEFERNHGVKLPESFLDLLRTKNGGLVNNRDFRFSGKEFAVSELKGIGEGLKIPHLKSLESIFSDSSGFDSRTLGKHFSNPAKAFLLADAGGSPDSYALDYNRVNHRGEPMVVWFCFDEDTMQTETVADSFAEFLNGQYQGDETPGVKLEEADSHKLIAEGEYSGRHAISDVPIEHSWKICADDGRLIVYQKTDFNGTKTWQKATLLKSGLVFSFVPLDESGVDVEPELADLIRHAVAPELLAQEESYANPDCYRLDLHVDPSQDNLVELLETTPFGERWKNSVSRVIYASVYSSDRSLLERAFQALADICGG
jgi:hypothetical protein